MEAGTISKWNLKEGDKFEPGTSLCDVETDKATVSFDATEEGYLAKILFSSGEIKVGQPLMITVDGETDIAAFQNYSHETSTAASNVTTSAPPAPETTAIPSSATTSSTTSTASTNTSYSTQGTETDRIFASPLAKKLTKESSLPLEKIKEILPQRVGSGPAPSHRLIAADVQKAKLLLQDRSHQTVSSSAAAATVTAHDSSSSSGVSRSATSVLATTPSHDLTVSDAQREFAHHLAETKRTVPHYYLSTELNLTALIALRERLNASLASNNKKTPSNDDYYSCVSVLDILLKAASRAMKIVPEVNASWMDSFVRQYDQVDLNVVIYAGHTSHSPVLRDVGNKGLLQIALELASHEEALATGASLGSTEIGTFSVHNLGVFGLRSASPVLVSPQAAALAFGAITESIVPRVNNSNPDEANWQVAPVLVATLVCDHRVVDGALSAQWLKAFKELVEHPEQLIL
jgi:pyruvate dehydrogenase E2 component (dihydrolipoamide acetyltransferase)